MPINKSDIETFANGILDGLIMPSQADLALENGGYFLIESNVGGQVVGLAEESSVDYLLSPPSETEGQAKKLLAYDSPHLDEWTVKDWVRDPDSMHITESESSFTGWIMELARKRGLDDADFSVDHATSIGQRVIQKLYDIDTENLED